MSRVELCREINSRVNAAPYRTDMEVFGLPDFWERVADGGRDCEDTVLEKRAQLLQAGVPLSDIRIGLCTTETKEPHAVLIVAVDEGHLILDNRQPQPYSLDEFRGLGYSGVSLQVPGQFMWTSWRTENA